VILGNCWGEATAVWFGSLHETCDIEVNIFHAKQRKKQEKGVKNTTIILYVREQLRLGMSPEAIAGRLSFAHPGESIDDDTIYEYIYHRKNRRKKFWQYLPHARKKRMKKEGRWKTPSDAYEYSFPKEPVLMKSQKNI
jgi:IS30 family transposase